jgi:hypothetical protein
MNDQDPLDRLFAAVRDNSHESQPVMPLGFPRKIVNHAWQTDPQYLVWWRGLRLGAVGALGLMALSILLNLSTLQTSNITTDSMFQNQIARLMLP